MKNRIINFYMMISGVCLALSLSGCISGAKSPTPRFYMLEAIDENQGSEKIDISLGTLIGIGPVKIPKYQDRPQIITQNKEKMLTFAQFDRWGESLDVGLARLIGENLNVILPTAKFALYPWDSAIPVKYQVVLEIVKLDSELEGDFLFVVQWLIIDLKNVKTMILKRSEFRQPISPQNYSGLVKTLSAAGASLSREIAEDLAVIEMRPLNSVGR